MKPKKSVKRSLKDRLATALPGQKFSFVRRRYGKTTFTWVYVQHAGERLSLGNPWPCTTPAVSKLVAATGLPSTGQRERDVGSKG